MKHPKLKRLKEGAFFATFFIGFNIIKNLIFDFSDTIALFREIWQNMRIALPIFIITFVSLWLLLTLVIGGGLIVYDFFKKKKVA